LFVLLFVYFLPSLIAGRRKVPNAGSVFVLNLFLGWTLIGWVIALSMAVRTVPAGSRPPGAGRMGGGAQMTFTHCGRCPPGRVRRERAAWVVEPR